MSKAENDYRLVIFEAPERPQAVRDLLCGVTGIHPTDAMQWVARTPGIWPRPLAEGEVRELLDGLYDLGVPAEAWRLDLLPSLSPPRNIHDAACLPDGLRITGLRGEPTHWVPWEKVDLISAGRIALEDEYRDVAPPSWTAALSTSLHALILRHRTPPPRKSRAVRIPRNSLGEVHIVRRDPRITFRVAEDKMNYAYLGDRLRPSAIENFPLFVADLCEKAQDAYITPTRALLEGANPDACEFPTSQALLDYSTHRLLWSWYRRDRDRDAEQETQS